MEGIAVLQLVNQYLLTINCVLKHSVRFVDIKRVSILQGHKVFLRNLDINL